MIHFPQMEAYTFTASVTMVLHIGFAIPYYKNNIYTKMTASLESKEGHTKQLQYYFYLT